MLHPDTAMHAVRILGVDAANLMSQVAVYRATVEELLDLAVQIDDRSWEPVMSDDDDARTVTKVMLPPDQQQIVQRILMLIHALR